MADIGLVGLPNAGKSTLLSKISAARPKVADYPFTTLSPNLGVAGDDERFVVADVPGLVEGAHQGRGLGHRFLRHVSRCRALAILVDLSAEDPAKDLLTVREEITAYDREMGERPSLIVGSKADLVDAEQREELTAALAGNGEVIAISALTGEGVQEVTARLHELAKAAAEAAEPRRPYVVLRPGRERFVVKREGERFRVIGRDVERWVLETDFDDPRSVTALQKRLVKEGVERQLAATGARRGDEIVIGDRAFEFYPEQDV